LAVLVAYIDFKICYIRTDLTAFNRGDLGG